MIHWIYLIPAIITGWAIGILCTCAPAPAPKQIEKETMFKSMLKGMFKRDINHIKNLLKWSLTKRWMREHAYHDGRMTAGLLASGTLRLWK